MNRIHGVAAAACALAMTAAILFLPRDDGAPPPVRSSIVPAPQPAAVSQRRMQTHAWVPDPMAAAMPAAVPPPHIVARQKKMQALMTGSPPQYYSMKLGQLRELARHGDADAMMQLAEQYLHEDGRLRTDPDYPVAENTRDLAKGYLAEGLFSGRIRAAALLSKELFDENKLGEAYAWRLVSEKLGDSVNPLWSDTNQFSSLTESEKALADSMAAGIINTLYQNKLREYMQHHPAAR